PEGEGEPQGKGGEGVGEVVERVVEERHRSAEQCHHQLDQGGGAEPDQGDPQRPDSLLARFQRRVDGGGRVVAVAGEPRQQAAAVLVAVVVAVFGRVIFGVVV